MSRSDVASVSVTSLTQRKLAEAAKARGVSIKELMDEVLGGDLVVPDDATCQVEFPIELAERIYAVARKTRRPIQDIADDVLLSAIAEQEGR